MFLGLEILLRMASACHERAGPMVNFRLSNARVPIKVRDNVSVKYVLNQMGEESKLLFKFKNFFKIHREKDQIFDQIKFIFC